LCPLKGCSQPGVFEWLEQTVSARRIAHQHHSLRRLLSLLTSPYLLVPLALVLLVGTGFLTYYYYRFTELIDAGLRGDIFVRASGIYAALLSSAVDRRQK
jgi:hypothetical protein